MPSAFEYPIVTEPTDSALLAVDMPLLPFVLGAVAQLQDRRYWQSDEDWYRAHEAISTFLECSMSTCLNDLLESNDKLYRLLDSGLNGTIYTYDGDPVVITPEIPIVPTYTQDLPGLIARINHLEEMIDALPGVVVPGWFGIGGEKATLADIIKALRVGTPEKAEEMVSTFNDILSDAGNLSSVGSLITDMFTGVVSDVEEGGILVVLAAGIVGTMAGIGALSSQLTTLALQITRIINSLDGGNIIPPSDNLLKAIRGTTAATDTRNVIDTLIANNSDNADILAKLEEVRALLV